MTKDDKEFDLTKIAEVRKTEDVDMVNGLLSSGWVLLARYTYEEITSEGCKRGGLVWALGLPDSE